MFQVAVISFFKFFFSPPPPSFGNSQSCSRSVRWCVALWCNAATQSRWRCRLSPSPHAPCPCEDDIWFYGIVFLALAVFLPLLRTHNTTLFFISDFLIVQADCLLWDMWTQAESTNSLPHFQAFITSLNPGSLPQTCFSVSCGSADSVKPWGTITWKRKRKDGRQMGRANCLAAFKSSFDPFVY